MSHDITRRTLLKGTLASVGGTLVAPLVARGTAAANMHVPGTPAGPESAYGFDQYPTDFQLFTAPGLPGGGQLEVRMQKSLDIYVNPQDHDPDDVEIALNLKWFNPQSWYELHYQMGEKNEGLAKSAGTPEEKNKYYLRAKNYYFNAVNYLSEHDPRMLPAYFKMEEMYNMAWTVVDPPFERIEIPYEGHMLQGEFYRAYEGAPVVVGWQGADSVLIGYSTYGGPWTSRGMSYLAFESPGNGGALRLQKLYMAPDQERLGQAVVDYLRTRSDVDLDRLGIYGASFGGYRAPRVCTAVKEFKACGVWSGAFDGLRDLFDYYPPIQDRMRWIIGAKNLKDARAKMGQYTLKNRVREIEAALMVGYSADDRVMNPYGALELYDKAVYALSRETVQGTGHTGPNGFAINRNTFFADWFAEQLGA